MRVRPLTAGLAAVSIAAAIAGCGGGGGDGGGSTTAAAKLPKPIAPTCGVDDFTPPKIGPAPGRPGGWELVYRFPAKAPRPPRPGETTVVDLLEEPPVNHRVRLKGGHDVSIAGLQVSLVRGTGFRSTVAEWTTRSARYIIIANGHKASTYERIIGCLR